MKTSSPSGTDNPQYYSSTAFTAVPTRISTNFNRNLGFGFGFNSPKNEPQKTMTLSTKVTNDIPRYNFLSNKPNGVLERKSSKNTPDATPKASPSMSSSVVMKGELSSGNSGYKTASQSRGNSADKRKGGMSASHIQTSQQTPTYRPPSSRGIQGGNPRREVGHSMGSKKLEIEIEEQNAQEAGSGSIRSRSTKNQETSGNYMSAGIKKNGPQYSYGGGSAGYKLQSSITPQHKVASSFVFTNKTKTEPNEDRVLRSSATLKTKQQEISEKPMSGSAVYGSNTATRESSKERTSVNGHEKEKPKTPLNGNNRKIGFSTNGTLKYGTLSQGVIKSNSFFSNSATNWSQATPKMEYKPQYQQEEDLTRSATFERKVPLKTQDLRASLKFQNETKETNPTKPSTPLEKQRQKAKEEVPESEPQKQPSLNSFVTKVNQGDIMSNMKKTLQDREVKSTRSWNKPVLAFEETLTRNGSNSVRDNGVKTTKNSEGKVSSYQYNKPTPPSTSSEQSTVKKSSKPSTPKSNKAEVKDFSQETNAVAVPAYTEKQKPFIYFMTSLEQHHQEYDESNYFCQIYREHFLQTFQAMIFCRYLKPVDQKVLASKRLALPRKDFHKDKKTLIFDLDETLIHCNESTAVPSDVILPIKFPHGEILEAGINVRPYALEILKELSQHYEIVVFTASHSCYANVVLDYLDPQKQYIQHRLFREHCIQTEEGVYVKDLRVISNRSLQDMIIVDNAAYSFGYQIENGIPIVPFYENKKDLELKHLIPYLKFLSSAKDPREINKLTFKLHMYSQYQSPDDVLDNVILQS